MPKKKKRKEKKRRREMQTQHEHHHHHNSKSYNLATPPTLRRPNSPLRSPRNLTNRISRSHGLIELRTSLGARTNLRPNLRSSLRMNRRLPLRSPRMRRPMRARARTMRTGMTMRRMSRSRPSTVMAMATNLEIESSGVTFELTSTSRTLSGRKMSRRGEGDVGGFVC